MNDTPPSPSWLGALQIVRFNWPAYAVAAVVAAACLFAANIPGMPRVVALTVLCPTAFWSASSIVVSHWIYDLSPLADWAWLPNWMPAPAGRWILVQAGFDSTHGALRTRLPTPTGVVDLYGAPGVGGNSVRRARAENVPLEAVATALPDSTASHDAILAIFALHEIAAPAARVEFFKMASRTLTPEGRLVVVEHLRDWRNFLAFGPGFFHFRAETEWRRCASAAGFELEKSVSVTPFVRAFCWRKP